MDKYFAIDAATGLIKRELGSAAVTTGGYQGTQHDQGGNVVTSIACVINIEAIEVGTDETYIFRLVGSQTADRSDAQILDTLELGKASDITVETEDTAAGDQFVMRARTQRNGDMFRYIDLHLEMAGTAESITYGAYITKEF